jgi:3-hydroxyacyl-CoA dehydrogenase
MTALKYASFPAVAAVHGAVLGGGLELVKACDGVVAKPITKSALVEANIGLVPGWLGVYETLVEAFGRVSDPADAVRHAYKMLSEPEMSRSAETAIENLSLPLDTKIVMNKMRLLSEGKAMALSLASGYQAPKLSADQVSLPDEKVFKELAKETEALVDAGKIKPHDYVVRLAMLHILSGGGKKVATRSEVAYLERTTLAALLRSQGGKAAIDKNLFKGKDGLSAPTIKEAALSDYKARWEDAASATPKDDLSGVPLPDDASHKGRAKMDDLAQKSDAFMSANVKK